jgi:hypothetical protein
MAHHKPHGKEGDPVARIAHEFLRISVSNSTGSSPLASTTLAYYRARRDLVDRLIVEVTAWRASERRPVDIADSDCYRRR